MSGAKLLLHVCCAPDAIVPWRELPGEGFDVGAYMFGGNIHPEAEYERRAAALEQLAAALGGGFVIAPSTRAAGWRRLGLWPQSRRAEGAAASASRCSWRPQRCRPRSGAFLI